MPPGVSSASVTPLLREAKAAETRAHQRRALSWFSAALAAFVALVTLVLWTSSTAWNLFFLALIVLPMISALRARTRAKGAAHDAHAALDRAWLAAAAEVTSKAKRGITVSELASQLKIDETRADRLLTELAADDRTRIDVDDDAEIRYSVAGAGGGPTKMRVEDERFRALDEVEAAQEQEDKAEAERALLREPFPRSPRR